MWRELNVLKTEEANTKSLTLLSLCVYLTATATQRPVAKSFKSQNRLLHNTPLSYYCFCCFCSRTLASLPHEDNVTTTTSATQAQRK